MVQHIGNNVVEPVRKASLALDTVFGHGLEEEWRINVKKFNILSQDKLTYKTVQNPISNFQLINFQLRSPQNLTFLVVSKSRGFVLGSANEGIVQV